MTPRPRSSPRGGSLTPRPFRKPLPHHLMPPLSLQLPLSPLNTKYSAHRSLQDDDEYDDEHDDHGVDRESDAAKKAADLQQLKDGLMKDRTEETEEGETTTAAPSPLQFASPSSPSPPPPEALTIAAAAEPSFAENKDSEYEFDAPQHYDFTAEASELEIDSWFDKCPPSPAGTLDEADFEGFDEDDKSGDQDDADDVSTTPKTAAIPKLPTSLHSHHSVDEDANENELCENEDISSQLAKLSVGSTSFEQQQQQQVASAGTTRESIWEKLSKPVDHSKQHKRRITAQPKPAARAKPAPRPSLALPPARPRPLTVPKEFSLVTRFRAKHALAIRSPGIQKKRFNIVPRRPNGTTRPKPFRFHSTLRAIAHEVVNDNAAPPPSPFVPLAVKVSAFSNEPERFRPLSGRDRRRVMPTSPWAGRMRMTRPQSPYLLTKMRTKPHHIPSREELELASLSAIQPFKANPLPSSILQAPAALPPPTNTRPVTIPCSPYITKPRALSSLRPRSPSPDRIPHARPIPRQVIEKPFEPVIEHRVMPVPEFELPGDQISRRKKEEFERRKKEEEERERELRGFRAQPLPFDDEGAHLPHIEPRPLTQPEPFMLTTDLRGAQAQQALVARLAREEQEREQRAQFHAQPFNAHLVLDRPFVPLASDKPLTSVEPVVLSSEQRAEERRAFDERRKEREREEERLRELRKIEEEEREKEEIRLMRLERVHRAQPVGARVHHSTIMHKKSEETIDAEPRHLAPAPAPAPAAREKATTHLNPPPAAAHTIRPQSSVNAAPERSDATLPLFQSSASAPTTDLSLFPPAPTATRNAIRYAATPAPRDGDEWSASDEDEDEGNEDGHGAGGVRKAGAARAAEMQKRLEELARRMERGEFIE
ncbi:Protein tpx2 [Geranomyces variabilis]|nr:Protein tpx2 [Geranomyces variabilis]